MKISVLAKANSKVESVEKAPDGSYVVRVNVPPVEGKANHRIVELLAKYFGVPKRSVEIISGQKGKKKVFKIATQ